MKMVVNGNGGPFSISIDLNKVDRRQRGRSSHEDPSWKGWFHKARWIGPGNPLEPDTPAPSFVDYFTFVSTFPSLLLGLILLSPFYRVSQGCKFGGKILLTVTVCRLQTATRDFYQSTFIHVLPSSQETHVCEHSTEFGIRIKRLCDSLRIYTYVWV